MTARSADCRCESGFTCRHCLANAKPYHYTLAGGGAIVGDAPGVQPNPRAAAMVAECAELLERFGDYELGDL